MKKFFTLFAAAVFGLSCFAQALEVGLKAVNTDNVAKVPVEIYLDNAREDLNLAQLTIEPLNGAKFVRAQGAKYFIPNAAYILKLLTVFRDWSEWKQGDPEPPVDFEVEDDATREEVLGDCADVNGVMNAGNLLITVGLKTKDCYTFPAEYGKLGEFAMNLSSVEDGKGIEVGQLSEDHAKTAFGLTNGQAEYPTVYKKVIVDKENGQITSISLVDAVKNVTSVKYYNIAGVESATPFQGVNIMVQTYDDGTKSATKVVK